MSLTKEERRQQLARTKKTRAKIAKATVVALIAVVAPLLAFLVLQG